MLLGERAVRGEECVVFGGERGVRELECAALGALLSELVADCVEVVLRVRDLVLEFGDLTSSFRGVCETNIYNYGPLVDVVAN